MDQVPGMSIYDMHHAHLAISGASDVLQQYVKRSDLSLRYRLMWDLRSDFHSTVPILLNPAVFIEGGGGGRSF